jgi:hypothetical protein
MLIYCQLALAFAGATNALADMNAESRQELPDSDFAVHCQHQVAHAFKGKLTISLKVADEATFLRTKPSVHADESDANVNVTMLLHEEKAALFNNSIALKMKSGKAIDANATEDDVTCASLHNASLSSALSALDTWERHSYGKLTKRLKFGADKLWHTGLWVALARLEVTESEKEITIVAPRFYASTNLPGNWGGVLYCRLVPPAAILSWIRAQLPGRPLQGVLV